MSLLYLDVVFALATEVTQSTVRRSGYEPAIKSHEGEHLFGELRLQGFSDIVKSRMTDKFIIVGGQESRFLNEDMPPDRPSAIRKMLIEDLDTPAEDILTLMSEPNTAGNMAAIRNYVLEHNPREWIITTSFYHVPRVIVMARRVGILGEVIPSEAFTVARCAGKNIKLLESLGNESFSRRAIEEICGIAAIISGTYKQRIC